MIRLPQNNPRPNVPCHISQNRKQKQTSQTSSITCTDKTERYNIYPKHASNKTAQARVASITNTEKNSTPQTPTMENEITRRINAMTRLGSVVSNLGLSTAEIEELNNNLENTDKEFIINLSQLAQSVNRMATRPLLATEVPVLDTSMLQSLAAISQPTTALEETPVATTAETTAITQQQTLQLAIASTSQPQHTESHKRSASNDSRKSPEKTTAQHKHRGRKQRRGTRQVKMGTKRHIKSKRIPQQRQLPDLLQP